MSSLNDAVVQAAASANSIVVGAATALASGLVDTAQASSLGILMQNAVLAEKNMQTIATTNTAVVCALIVVKGSNPS